MIHSLNVRFVYSTCPPTSGEVHIQTLTSRQRWTRAFKAWGYCWLAAIGAVFLPLLHFILVPLLVLMGPILGIRKLCEKTLVLSGTGACPSCKAPVTLSKSANKWPLDGACPSCHQPFEVEKTEMI